MLCSRVEVEGGADRNSDAVSYQVAICESEPQLRVKVRIVGCARVIKLELLRFTCTRTCRILPGTSTCTQLSRH